MAKTVVYKATPEMKSVCIVGVCEICGGSIQATYMAGNRMFAWYHRATGSEECAPKTQP